VVAEEVEVVVSAVVEVEAASVVDEEEEEVASVVDEEVVVVVLLVAIEVLTGHQKVLLVFSRSLHIFSSIPFSPPLLSSPLLSSSFPFFLLPIIPSIELFLLFLFSSNPFTSNISSKEMGTFLHTAESDLVIKSTHADIPKFNSMLYFQDKSEIGKVDEIFGPINEVVRPLYDLFIQCG
jgi:hypothetical protein